MGKYIYLNLHFSLIFVFMNLRQLLILHILYNYSVHRTSYWLVYFKFSSSTLERMYHSKNVFFSSIQLNHTQATFIQRSNHLTETIFQLGIGIVIFNKRLRRVFVDVQLTKILFQLRIIGIGRVIVCEKLYWELLLYTFLFYEKFYSENVGKVNTWEVFKAIE